jgi:hypothetical protein
VERQIDCVARIARLSEHVEPVSQLSPAESFAEVEQLRRMFPEDSKSRNQALSARQQVDSIGLVAERAVGRPQDLADIAAIEARPET